MRAFFDASGPVYVATVCARDHWEELADEERAWCVDRICEAVKRDADTHTEVNIFAHNPMGRSHPAAFILSALFNKGDLTALQRVQLLPALACAVTHAVEEVVRSAVNGIGAFLWQFDRTLALTCLLAVVTKAREEQRYRHQRRQLPLEERAYQKENFHVELRHRLQQTILQRTPGDETELLALNFHDWVGRIALPYLLSALTPHADDELTRRFMIRVAVSLVQGWEIEIQGQRSYDRREEDRFDPETEHLMAHQVARFALHLAPGDALALCTPVFTAAERFPGKVAGFLKELILAQDVRKPTPTFWTLWQHFADDFVAGSLPSRVDEKHAESHDLLRHLFLNVEWQAGEREWPPMKAQEHRLRTLFEQLPPSRAATTAYARFLAYVGAHALPDALTGLMVKVQPNDPGGTLDDNGVYYLETILQRLIYGGERRLRNESPLRTATLALLDALVAAGSSAGYRMRDDLLTPLATPG